MNTHMRWWIVIAVATILAVTGVIIMPFKQGLDLKGGVRVVLQAQKDQLPPEKQKNWGPEQMHQVANIVRNRVDGLGVAEPVITEQLDKNRIVVELPGVVNEQDALRIIQTTAQLEFRYLPSVVTERNLNARFKLSTLKDRNGKEVVDVLDTINNKLVPVQEFLKAESEMVVTGADLVSTRVEADQSGKPQVAFEFNADGARTFGEFTRTHIGDILAIVLDNRIISAPVINSAILEGRGVIEGSFDMKEAAELSSLLNSGSLPVPLSIIQTSKIGATLGKEAVQQSLIAGLVGLGLVLVFMVSFYYVPGVVACVALALYTLFSLAVYKAIGATFTVPGIAAFILSIGMAVDANVLIFERVKEELRHGKTIKQSIDDGFKRAFSAILDSNICSIITCIILWNMGNGSIKGFALMLGLGVVISMFTAITVTRTMLWTLVDMNIAHDPKYFGANRGIKFRVDVINKRNIWFTISGLIVVLGIAFYAMHGFKLGVDFTGGSELTVKYTKTVTAAQVQDKLKSMGYGEASAIVSSDGETVYVRNKEMNVDQKETMKKGLATLASNDVASFEQGFEQVSGLVSGEQTKSATLAVVLSWALILLYIAIRFAIGGVKQGFKFGVAAIIAVLHDVFVLCGLFAIMGAISGWQVDALFVTALLTLIGFSTHDTIVVFDRIRENLRHQSKEEHYDDLVNRSINETLGRSVNTSMTVVLTLVALLIFGSPVTKLFNIALIVGIITGTYSSIFNASPIVVVWEKMAAARAAKAKSA